MRNMRKSVFFSASLAILAAFLPIQAGASDDQEEKRGAFSTQQVRNSLDLPEIVRNVCEFLDSKSLWYARSTSRHFDDYYKKIRGAHVVLDGEHAEEFITSTKAGDYPHVRLLTLKGNWKNTGELDVSRDLFGLLRRNSTRVMEIEIKEPAMSGNDAVFLAKYMPWNLQALSIDFGKDGKELEKMSFWLPRGLRVLKLRNYHSGCKATGEYTASDKCNILKKLPGNLSSLEIHFGRNHDFPEGEDFLGSLPASLESLTFVDCRQEFTYSWWDNLFTYLHILPEHIHRFTLKADWLMQDLFGNGINMNIVMVLGNLPNWKRFDLDGLNLLVGPHFLKMHEGEDVPEEYLQKLTGKDIFSLAIIVKAAAYLQADERFGNNPVLGRFQNIQPSSLVKIAKKYNSFLFNNKEEQFRAMEAVLTIWKAVLEKGGNVRETIGNLYEEAARTVSGIENKGTLYFEFIHASSSLELRYKCLKEAIKYGNKKAQYELGILYRDGKHFDSFGKSKPNPDRAMECFLPLAEEGDPKAQHNVGMIYFKKGMKEEAIQWFQKAADQGLEASINNLKKMMEGSQGQDRK